MGSKIGRSPTTFVVFKTDDFISPSPRATACPRRARATIYCAFQHAVAMRAASIRVPRRVGGDAPANGITLCGMTYSASRVPTTLAQKKFANGACGVRTNFYPGIRAIRVRCTKRLLDSTAWHVGN